MNYIDIFLIITLFLFFAIGWKLRGIYLIIVPIAFFTGIITANIGYTEFSRALTFMESEEKRLLLSYTLLFLLGSCIIVFAAITAARFFDFFKLTFIDRALGAFIFMSAAAIPLYLFMNMLNKLTLTDVINYHTALVESFLFGKLESYALFLVKLPLVEHLSVMRSILN
ncbi:MAG: hypothetical protein ACLFP1_02765 [Candidatus Goldiibacteriota bacterium]